MAIDALASGSPANNPRVPLADDLERRRRGLEAHDPERHGVEGRRRNRRHEVAEAVHVEDHARETAGRESQAETDQRAGSHFTLQAG